mgnify:CR=1 FL=1
MSGQSEKFVISPLGVQARWDLSQVMGLDEWPFYFLEEVDHKIVRSIFVQGKGQPLLRNWTRERWELESEKEAAGLVVMEYPTWDIPIRSMVAGQTLWQACLPYPLSLLNPLEATPWGNFRWSDSKYEKELRLLSQSLVAAEEVFARSEVSLVEFKRGEKSVSLLLHYVRNQRIAVGTHSRAEEYGQILRGDLEDTGGLISSLGSSIQHFTLNFPNHFNGSPVERASELIQSLGSKPAPAAPRTHQPEISL